MEEFSRELPDLGGAAVCGEAVAIMGAPSSVEEKAFNAFWYGHMLEELMQPPLCSIDYSTAKYIWNSARAADAPSKPSEKKAVAWIDQFGNVFPLGAYQPSGKPSYLDADKRGWKPLFRAADALDSQPTYTAPGVPEGFLLVPIIPTQEILDAIEDAAKAETSVEWDSNLGANVYFGDASCVYNAILAVKPEVQIASSQPTDGTPAQQLYRFKRFHKGVLMADGIGVHATTMDDAIERAQKLMDRGDTIEFESNRPCVRKCGICQPTDGGVRNG